MTETGLCRKCKSDIPLQAERCPQCQYDPGKPVLGGLGKIIGFILMLGAVFQILLGILLLFTPLIGAPIQSAILAAGLFSFSGLIQGAIAAWIGGFKTKFAAEQPSATEESASFTEEMKDAHEQGKEYRARIAHRIDQLPDRFFNALIAGATILVIASLVVLIAGIDAFGTESTDLAGLLLIGSLPIMAYTVMADVDRTNRTHETEFKSWAWAFSAVVPVINVLVAYLWIRKRHRVLNDKTST